jgi:hypothetical protein
MSLGTPQTVQRGLNAQSTSTALSVQCVIGVFVLLKAYTQQTASRMQNSACITVQRFTLDTPLRKVRALGWLILTTLTSQRLGQLRKLTLTRELLGLRMTLEVQR